MSNLNCFIAHSSSSSSSSFEEKIDCACAECSKLLGQIDSNSSTCAAAISSSSNTSKKNVQKKITENFVHYVTRILVSRAGGTCQNDSCPKKTNHIDTQTTPHYGKIDNYDKTVNTTTKHTENKEIATTLPLSSKKESKITQASSAEPPKLSTKIECVCEITPSAYGAKKPPSTGCFDVIKRKKPITKSDFLISCNSDCPSVLLHNRATSTSRIPKNAQTHTETDVNCQIGNNNSVEEICQKCQRPKRPTRNNNDSQKQRIDAILAELQRQNGQIRQLKSFVGGATNKNAPPTRSTTLLPPSCRCCHSNECCGNHVKPCKLGLRHFGPPNTAVAIDNNPCDINCQQLMSSPTTTVKINFKKSKKDEFNRSVVKKAQMSTTQIYRQNNNDSSIIQLTPGSVINDRKNNRKKLNRFKIYTKRLWQCVSGGGRNNRKANFDRPCCHSCHCQNK